LRVLIGTRFFRSYFLFKRIDTCQEPRLRNQTFHGDMKIYEDENSFIRSPKLELLRSRTSETKYLRNHSWLATEFTAWRTRIKFSKNISGESKRWRHLLENIKREETQAPFYHI